MWISYQTDYHSIEYCKKKGEKSPYRNEKTTHLHEKKCYEASQIFKIWFIFIKICLSYIIENNL